MIVYNKLMKILQERNMQLKDLLKADISINTLTKFSQNKTMNTDNIDKVCIFLNIQPSDMMEVVKSEKELKKKSIQTQIEILQRQLAELQKEN